MIAKGVPTLSYGLRGVTACEVRITGSKMDLHSGVFGGAVANSVTALARLLATLHDENGHVAIEGFYDQVKPLEDWEREAWRKLPIDADKEILDETGVTGALWGRRISARWSDSGRDRPRKSTASAAVTKGREPKRSSRVTRWRS